MVKTPKGLSLNKLEGLRYFLNEAIEAGTFKGEHTREAAGWTLLNLDEQIGAIKRAAPSTTDHEPRWFTQLGSPWRMGCSCGWYPSKPMTRSSTSHVPFTAHRRSLNLDPHNGYGVARYADGPYLGKTWDEAYDEDKAAKFDQQGRKAS